MNQKTIGPNRNTDHCLLFLGFCSSEQRYTHPCIKKAFNLSQVQSQLVSFAFYVLILLLYYLFCYFKNAGSDLLNKMVIKTALRSG